MKTKATLLLAACVIAFASSLLALRPAGNPAQPAMDALDARLSSVEEKVNVWPQQRSSLADRIAQVDKSSTAGIRRARAETTALVEGLRREMNRGGDVQREARDEVARLREELAVLRRELDEMRKERGPEASRPVN
jgi:chromosome segregation ATPase